MKNTWQFNIDYLNKLLNFYIKHFADFLFKCLNNFNINQLCISTSKKNTFHYFKSFVKLLNNKANNAFAFLNLCVKIFMCFKKGFSAKK